ncbi:hypothetical protein Tco_0702117 [Tanacetum coccineum]|uniref:Uncharacterized protein n=1 Tax=Tanacetum coccineum TaxID=301880 RepID=A0ABQ4XVY0_9ASTR
MHFVENRIGHTFDQNVGDFQRMVEMCLCDVDRMAAMGMWFDCMAVMRIGYNIGKQLSDNWFIALITSVSRLSASVTMYRSWLLTL